MRLLVVGADHPLGRAVVIRFAREHDVKSATWAGPYGQDNAAKDLTVVHHTRKAEIDCLVEGVDTIVYLIEYESQESNEDEAWLIERATLAPYRLLQAAREAGVTRVVLGSTLRLFDSYPEDCVIDEQWMPRPKPEARALAPHLCEQTCREFAREGPMAVVALRFDSSEIENDGTVALSAIEKALELPMTIPGYRWQVFHIANLDRYVTRQAQIRLGWAGRKGIGS